MRYIFFTLRPIVGGPKYPTSHLSNFIDILIKPLVIHVKSHLRDGIEFLNKLPRNVPMETIMTSFDIVSLYTNIPHDLGVEAIDYWIKEYPESISARFSRSFVIKGIKIILNNNTFFSNEKIFLQKKGTAMGIKMAPSYATLVLRYLERSMYQDARNRFGEETGTFNEDNWMRYLDDCYINWTFEEQRLKVFNELLNSLNTNVRFTVEYSKEQIAFLDVLIKKDKDRLTPDINYKITDMKQYLHYQSNHPRHIKRNSP